MKNPYLLWKRTHIYTIGDLLDMRATFYNELPTIGGFDTETTGLHIIKDKPFLIQFGWIKGDSGRVFTFYPTTENMRIFFELTYRLNYCVAQNIKYDCHMLSNIGYAKEVQAMTNLCENMVIARLSLEAIPDREGGDSLALKELGKNRVHPDATKSESIIKDELRKLNVDRIKALTAALKQFPTGELTASGRPKYWGKGHIEKFLKDPTNDIEDLPEGVKDVWLDWQEEYPEPTYADVDRPTMIKYGAEDIITMLEFFRLAYPFVVKREQLSVLERENKFILPCYRMERVGLKVDLDYLESARIRVKQYIVLLRKELTDIAGEVITVNQHERLKFLFKTKWNIELPSADKKAMKDVQKAYDGASKRFAQIITALRSVEKWYSTYIKRIQDHASYDGKLYTQINQAGAVSGRMSCDVQQFPKNPLKTLDGEELFHPRKTFTVKGGNYESIVYIDYDQIELVTQAHYTLLVSGGDLNLCRAYMPYKCHHYLEAGLYDYKNPRARARWNEKQPNGESAWLDENNIPWTKTDVHAQTTHKAFPHIPLGTDEFKVWRSKGKVFNFLANYGGGKDAAITQLDIKEDEADALVRGYNEAFPGVVIYQKAIQRAHQAKGYVHNHYGRRYYLSDTSISYKLANYNIQGTCADALKEAIIRVDEYLKDKKSKLVIPIHDELQFDIFKGEEWIVPDLLRIMQEAFSWCLVPVTAGVEITYTNWKEKKEE